MNIIYSYITIEMDQNEQAIREQDRMDIYQWVDDVEKLTEALRSYEGLKARLAEINDKCGTQDDNDDCKAMVGLANHNLNALIETICTAIRVKGGRTRKNNRITRRRNRKN